MMENNTMLGKTVVLLCKMTEGLGLVFDLLEKMNSVEGERWRENLAKFLRKEPCWGSGQVTQVTQPKPTPSILELVGTTTISATTGKFVAKEKFMVGTKHNAPVKISYLNDDFITSFLQCDSKIENPVGEHILGHYKLRRSSPDDLIIAELGGLEKVETTLSEIFFVMKDKKKRDILRRCRNIFYIKDISGALRVIDVEVYEDRLCIYAYPIGNSIWHSGDCVFC